MHVEFRVTESEYRAAAMLAMRKRSSLTAFDYYLPYTFAVIWLAGSTIPSPLNGYLEQPADLLLTLGVLPIFLGFLWMRRKSMKEEYLKLKQFHLHQALDLDTNGLRLVTTAGTTRSSWDTYSKFAEDKNSFILFRKLDETILPIPKNHLTIAQVDELHTLLTARIPPQT
jgi:YcxB-like protein